MGFWWSWSYGHGMLVVSILAVQAVALGAAAPGDAGGSWGAGPHGAQSRKLQEKMEFVQGDAEREV